MNMYKVIVLIFVYWFEIQKTYSYLHNSGIGSHTKNEFYFIIIAVIINQSLYRI